MTRLGGTTSVSRVAGAADPLANWFLRVAIQERSAPATRLQGMLAVLLLLAFAYAIVYATGGTRFAYVHFGYVPILMASFLFGSRGGLIVGLVAGAILGPSMPMEVASNTPQSLSNWLIRMSFFVVIGAVAGFAADILRRQLKILRLHAYHDQVSGLPNRAYYLESLQLLLASRAVREPPLVALVAGLGNFEETVASLGYAYADKLHRAAAERLGEFLPPNTRLFSITPGLFAVIHDSPQKAQILGLKLAHALDDRFEIDNVPTLAAGHAAIACHHDDADALSLMRAAIASFRRAEQANERLVIYDGALDRVKQSTLRLLPDLQEAIHSDKGLVLHFQPIIDLSDGRCKSVEALLRWHHPELGTVPPSSYLPAAEKTALMRPLTRLVLDHALRQLKDWQEVGLDLDLAVNVSVRDIEDKSFAAMVARLLEKYGLTPSRLIIEVTESALMNDPAVAVESLTALSSSGVSIALDDFGTGQSSLSYLARLPVDIVKLDRQFAREMAESNRVEVVVRAAIEAAHRMGQKVVAEGIEDQETLGRFRELSCDFAQGYSFGRPMPSHAFGEWLVEQGARALRDQRAAASELAEDDVSGISRPARANPGQ
jgi:diguanylate cyclase